MSRRWLSPEAASDIGRLDPEAIARVRSEAWPEATNADELHDALVWLGFLSTDEAHAGPGWSDWLSELAQHRRVTRLDAAHAPLWITAESLPQFQAMWPAANFEPAIAAPDAYAEREWSREAALVEILRGRLEGLGPVTAETLTAPLGLAPAEAAAALAALEAEGFAMRGRFTPGAEAEEWCERRLLARIHSYTVRRLRAEIEPVAARDFLRFLLGWQRVTADTRMEGPHAVDTVVGQLEGFEAPAGAWESEILPARLAGYEPTWLDDRCLAGHVAWTRLRPRAGRAGNGRTSNGRPNGSESKATTPVRTTPITLIARRHAALWGSLSIQEEGVQPGHRAQLVLDHIRAHGASFFDELMDGTGLLRSQVEEALGELVTLGLVSSDSFGGLRALLVPSGERRPIAGAHRRRRTAKFGMEEAGRWALVRRPRPAASGARADAGAAQQAVEHVARALLLRYGVVFWRLIEREAAWLPPWRDLLRVYRRLESRGDIRGGRFVAGFSGEQFALPDAVATLREVRRQPASGALVSLSGADPLNLAGILTPGPRLAALTGNRLLYRDGVPIALLASGEVQFLETLDAAGEWAAHKALLRSAVPGPPRAPDAVDRAARADKSRHSAHERA
jgi:ATP-dependent Lhr-like helicase